MQRRKLVIIGIVLAVGGSVSGCRGWSDTDHEVDKTKGNINLILKTIDRYYDEKDAYPDRLVDLIMVDSCRDLLGNTVAIDTAGNFVDGFGNKIIYNKTGGRGKRPMLTSPGPDKMLNTADDITVP